MWIFTFGTNIILLHTIISYRIASHHTSFCISKKSGRNKEKLLPRKYLSDHKRTCCSTRYAFGRRGIFFFMKHEKKGRCFFARGSKTVCTKVSCITKIYITLTHIQILDVWFLQKTKAINKHYTLKYTKF